MSVASLAHAADPSPVLPLMVPALALVGYLGALATRAPGTRPWSRWRTASFCLGTALLAAGLSPSLSVRAGDDFRFHVVGHLLVGMFAPLALVGGAPLTVLLATLPVRAARAVTRLARMVPVRVLGHPAVAASLATGGMYALYLTPLWRISSGSETVHVLVHTHLLVSGLLFAWSMASPDPAPHRPGVGVRLAVLVAAGAAHAFLAKLLYAHPSWIGGPEAAVVEGAVLMYYGGDVFDLALTVGVLWPWYRVRGRRTTGDTVRGLGTRPPGVLKQR